MRVVMKFGGTSVSDVERIENVTNILEMNKDNEIVVIVSAMKGVTDSLLEIANRVADGRASIEDLKNFISGLKKNHEKIARKVTSGKERVTILEELERFCSDLEKVLTGIHYVGELTPRSLDYVLSFGERLSASIICGAVNSAGMKAKWLTGHEAGIITDSNYGKASPIWSSTRKKVKRVLEPLLGKQIPILAGFIAGNSEGNITTLGRGGSDYTASIIGASLDAEEMWIWTDVDGIMTTDPRIVKEARTIPEISYIEAMEMAFFGAKVMHPKSVEPAMERGIPVRVKNTFNPRHQGTLIVKEQEKTSEIVKAVSVMRDVALITISGVGMVGMPGVAARVFSTLAEEKINILMISQGSSEVNISLIVEKGDLKRAIRAIKNEFSGTGIVKHINYDMKVSIVAVVGAGMQGTKGVAARVFTAVAKAGVNILTIAQGSSEVNISFVIARKDAKKAVKALHDEFGLGRVS